MQAYKAGKKTLAQVLQENKMSEEEAVNTVLDLQDVRRRPEAQFYHEFSITCTLMTRCFYPIDPGAAF